jgi:hypothetical protein
MQYSAYPRGILLSVLAVAGCKTELIPLDAGPPEAALCLGHHHQETTPLALLEPFDLPEGLAMGRAVRVRATVVLRAGCDVPGPIDVAVQPGDATDFVELTAHVWRSDLPDGACGSTSIARPVLVLSDAGAGVDNPRVSVRDAAPGGTLALVLELQPPAKKCTAATLKAQCTLDCQCETGAPTARCIPGSAAIGACYVPCSEDADCAAGDVCGAVDGLGLAMVCGPPHWPVPCRDVDCPFGQRCVTDAGQESCRPVQTATPETPCSCDAECGFGGVCALNVDLAYCQIPCVTSNDCPHSQSSCVSGECHMLE